MWQNILNFLAEDKAYFISNKKEITAKNNHMLLNGCIIYAGVLIFYTVMTSFTRHSEPLQIMYYAFDVIHAALCIAVFTRSAKNKDDYKTTQLYCGLFEISILVFFALEAVYTSQTQHSLYVPIAILLVLLLFIHNAYYTNAITLLYVLFVAVLSRLYKTPEAYMNDRYIAIATLISATIGNVLISKMRHNEGAALRKYESLSKADPLTGLLNKAAMESLCAQIIAEPNQVCTLIVLDVDHFKSVNDTYGHDAGDEVLCSVARALQASFRDRDSIGRFGGDEFIVLMQGCTERQIVTGRVEKILDQIAHLRFSQAGLSVRCSAGIAMQRADDVFQSLFKRADQALYEAKANGKGCYHIDSTL